MKYFWTILLVLMSLPLQLSAQNFSTNSDECYMVFGSRQTLEELSAFAETHRNFITEFEAYESSNGWLVLSLGRYPKGSFESIKSDYVSYDGLPGDTFCSSGENFVERLAMDVSENGTISFGHRRPEIASENLGILPQTVSVPSSDIRGVVQSDDGELNLRAGPSTETEILHVLMNGQTVTLIERQGNWGFIEVCCAVYPLEGWVYLPLVDFSENAIQQEHDRWQQARNQCPPAPTGHDCSVSFASCETYEAFRFMQRYAAADPNSLAFYPFGLINLVCDAPETEIVAFTEFLDQGVFGFTVNESGEDVMYRFDFTTNNPGIARAERLPSSSQRNSQSLFDLLYGNAVPSDSSVRCISVSGDCTGLDCIIDEMTLSGGLGDVDNSWSSPMVCSGYNGALNGTYNYIMKTNFDQVCSGSFQISSRAQSGIVVNIYEDCNQSYVSEY